MKRTFLLNSLIFVVACTWAAAFIIGGDKLPPRIFGSLGTVTTVAGFAVFVLDKWAWSWPGVSHVLKRPDLRGTWAGTITPLDPTTRQPKAPIEAYAVVRQSFTSVHLRLFTAESVSITLAADFVDEGDGVLILATVYRNEPKLSVTDRSAVHHGGTKLRLAAADGTALDGSYWTDRWTCGEMILRRRARSAATDFTTAKAASTSG